MLSVLQEQLSIYTARHKIILEAVTSTGNIDTRDE